MFNLCHLSWTKTVRSCIASRPRAMWRTHESNAVTVREYKIFNLAAICQPSGPFPVNLNKD